MMTSHFIFAPKTSDSCSQHSGRLIQIPRSSKALILDSFPKVILYHAAVAAARSAHNDISETNIRRHARHSTADANHQADSDIGKSVQHVSCDACSSAQAVLSFGQNGDDYIMPSYLTHNVCVVIIYRHVRRALVNLVEKCTRCNELCGYGADPADSVMLVCKSSLRGRLSGCQWVVWFLMGCMILDAILAQPCAL
jgi:hypothetical protein